MGDTIDSLLGVTPNVRRYHQFGGTNPCGLGTSWAERQIAMGEKYVDASFVPFCNLALQIGRACPGVLKNLYCYNFALRRFCSKQRIHALAAFTVRQNITIPAAGSVNEGGFGMLPAVGMSPLPPITPIIVATSIFVEQPLVFSVLDPASKGLDQSIPQTEVTARRSAIADKDPFLQHPTQTKADEKRVGLVDDYFEDLGRYK